MNDTGQVTLHIEAGVASVLFDRPRARNAMTWAMYEQLGAIARTLMADASVRCVVFRGAGGQAFVAGTDIEQFTAFTTGEDGVAYEQQIEACIGLLSSLPMPTVAVIDGWCVGGGLAIATSCDFRLATPGARFGVPIARTLGNCLSIQNVARLSAAFGPQRVRRMLLLAEFIGDDEALACGYLHAVETTGSMDSSIASLTQQLAALAPVTQRVSKAALERLVTHGLAESDDLVRAAYGSHDFHEGVAAFVAKRPPVWSGR